MKESIETCSLSPDGEDLLAIARAYLDYVAKQEQEKCTV